MNSLPLSWSIVENELAKTKSIKKWNLNWLALQNIPLSKLQLQTSNLSFSNDEIVIRGCNSNLAQNLENVGFSSIQIGMEALLDLKKDHFGKKSIKELIKRGTRHGRIELLNFSSDNYSKLNNFQEISSHGSEPQLRNLFQTQFNRDNLLYVFLDDRDNWLAAILLSENSPLKLHTELILRLPNAPVGIMEALVYHVFNEARIKNYSFLSLGEVPFTSNDEVFKDSKSLIAVKFGRLLNFAYNYKGLYNFKNKFQPSWENLYICTSTKTRIKHLLFLSFYSNFHRLVIYKLIARLKIFLRLSFINLG